MTLSRRRWWSLFAVAVLANLALLFWPRAVDTGGVGIPHLDKMAHAASFALVTWTGLRAGIVVWALSVVLALHAGTSEVVQHRLLAERTGDPADVLADLTGVAVVVLALGAASWRHGHGTRDREDDREAARREHRAG